MGNLKKYLTQICDSINIDRTKKEKLFIWDGTRHRVLELIAVDKCKIFMEESQD